MSRIKEAVRLFEMDKEHFQILEKIKEKVVCKDTDRLDGVFVWFELRCECGY